MQKGQMEIRVLEDGTIRVETNDMGSGVVHKAADDFLKMVAQLMGGEVDTTKVKQGHHHHHDHGHDHEHAGQ